MPERTMPRYFFNVENSSTVDDDGTELPDLATAKCEAVKLAGRMICDASNTFWDTQEINMIVTDERGMTLFLLDFIGTEAPAVGPRTLSI
jgi:hypothetical protein